MLDKLTSLFIKHGFDHSKAKVLSTVFTENSLCGVASHGINRVPLFIDFVKNGLIDIHAETSKLASFGNIERWDGNSGPGILNAIACTNRASELAKIHGMGMVALKNTNHWMRGGYYGWLAAQNDCMAIMFTNTKPNMPAWAVKNSVLAITLLLCLYQMEIIPSY